MTGFESWDPHPRAVVPCRSCQLCCRTQVMLLPDEGDDVASYDHEIITLPDAHDIGPAFADKAGLRGPVLRRTPEGACVYLEPAGCSIRDRAPVICRVFDCRSLLRARSPREVDYMVATGQLDEGIVRQARRLRRKGGS